MPDTEISRLTELPAVLVDEKDVLAIVDVSASETKKVKAVALAEAAVDALADGTLDPDKIDWNGLDPGVIDGTAIKDRSLDGVKLKLDTVTASEIAPNAIGASELADAACDTAAIASNAITADKISSEALEARHYSTGSIGSDALAENSVGSSELASGACDTASIQDQAVTADKLAANLDGDSILASGSVDSAIGSGAVDANNLASGAVTTNAIAPGAVTNTQLDSGLDGTKLADGSTPVTKLQTAGFSDGIELDGTIKHSNEITAGSANGITFDAQGHVTGTTDIESAELPIATTLTVGAVSVPTSSGLTVSGTGALDHADTITPGTASKVTFNSHGHITGTSSLSGNDLPVATTNSLGAVIVPSAGNNPLSVDSAGNLTHNVSGVTAGTYVNVTVNSHGHVTDGSETLSVNQVPGLPADKITSGQFGTARLADDSVTMPKLADYAISFIQEAQPPISTDLHIGCLWYQESSAQLRMWNGNSFMPVGFGRLSQENLRFGGTVNAETGNIVSLTDAGRTAGLTAGDPVPTATDALGGLYLVVMAPGNAIGVLPGTNFDAGDWLLCINATEGWIRIDTLNGGGGGGGSQLLNDLLDVDINNVQGGDTLIYDANLGQWTNRTTTADRVTMSPAFDGSQTTFTLSMNILDQNNVLMSLAGVVLEPLVDFQIVAGSNQITFADAPPEGSDYFLINQQTVNAAGGGGGGGGTTLPPGTSAQEYLRWNNTLSSWQPASDLDGGSF